MIVATSTDQKTIFVGITEADVKELRRGLTKTKEGSSLFNFRTLIVFMGESDEAMLHLLQQPGTVRQDDPK